MCTRTGAVFGTFSAFLLSLTTLVAFVIDVVLFSILKGRFNDAPYDDRKTTYGPALWMTLVAVIASLVTLASAGVTAFSRSRYPRKWESEQVY